MRASAKKLAGLRRYHGLLRRGHREEGIGGGGGHFELRQPDFGVRLRAGGLGVVRWISADLRRPLGLARRLAAAFQP